MDLPWQRSPLNTWSIVGMNHYFNHSAGSKCLFVAMAKGDMFIKAEAIDGKCIWDSLSRQAREKSNNPIHPTDTGG